MKRDIVVYVVAGIMVFTICFASSAHAIVPAFAYGVWLGVGVIAGSAAIYDANHDKTMKISNQPSIRSRVQGQNHLLAHVANHFMVKPS